jgi:D-amino peptidase
VRVMIWVDMEGIAGIETWDQVSGGKPQYEEGRRLMTGEVSAAVRGAKAAGADDIVVVDCHGAGGSYSFNKLLSLCTPSPSKIVASHGTCCSPFRSSAL